MITTAQLLSILKAVTVILPLIVAAVREGRLKSEAMDDVLEAVMVRLDQRIARARAAKPDDSGLRDPNQRD